MEQIFRVQLSADQQIQIGVLANMTENKGVPYREGELEIILSLVPTKTNIAYLAKLLGRSEDAVRIVYKMAYKEGKFGKNAEIQSKKIRAAKARVGIDFG